jgi:hypothetical protein
VKIDRADQVLERRARLRLALHGTSRTTRQWCSFLEASDRERVVVARELIEEGLVAKVTVRDVRFARPLLIDLRIGLVPWARDTGEERPRSLARW